jgi:hypothetical protein
MTDFETEQDKKIAARIQKGKETSKKLWYKVYKKFYAKPVKFCVGLMIKISYRLIQFLTWLKRKAIPF